MDNILYYKTLIKVFEKIGISAQKVKNATIKVSDDIICWKDLDEDRELTLPIFLNTFSIDKHNPLMDRLYISEYHLKEIINNIKIKNPDIDINIDELLGDYKIEEQTTIKEISFLKQDIDKIPYNEIYSFFKEKKISKRKVDSIIKYGFLRFKKEENNNIIYFNIQDMKDFKKKDVKDIFIYKRDLNVIDTILEKNGFYNQKKLISKI